MGLATLARAGDGTAQACTPSRTMRLQACVERRRATQTARAQEAPRRLGGDQGDGVLVAIGEERLEPR